MNYNYILELKYRVLLTTLSFTVVINISYFYKSTFLFLLLKYLAYNEFIDFYVISTNILELLSLYFNITCIMTNNIMFYFIAYNFLIFLNYALYQREYISMKLTIYLWLIINMIITLFAVIIILPIMWRFLKYYQKPSTVNLICFETKVTEYYIIFYNIYLLTAYCLLFMILTLSLLKNYLNKLILVKLRKITIFTVITLLTVTNDILVQLTIWIFFIACYESLLLYVSYSKYYNR